MEIQREGRESLKTRLTVEGMAHLHKAHQAQQGERGQTADAEQHAAEGVQVAHGPPVQPPGGSEHRERRKGKREKNDGEVEVNGEGAM